MVKVCLSCQESKKLGEFHRRTKSADGLSYRCKTCIRQARYAVWNGVEFRKSEAARVKGYYVPHPRTPPTPEGMKRCGWCELVKEHSEFSQSRSRTSKDGLTAKCKACGQMYAAEWRLAHPEYKRLQRIKDVNRDGRRKREYGLTPEQYQALLVAQNHVCAICKDPEALPLVIDHDHATGRVRGLLCNPHNWMLGHARDSKVVLLNASDYLDRAA